MRLEYRSLELFYKRCFSNAEILGTVQARGEGCLEIRPTRSQMYYGNEINDLDNAVFLILIPKLIIPSMFLHTIPKCINFRRLYSTYFQKCLIESTLRK